jgi:hypothetical protein
MISDSFRNLICLVVGLICTSVSGGELTGLIAGLQKLEASGPIRAVVHIEENKPATDDKEDARKLEKADLIITTDANGLTISVKGDISNAGIFGDLSLLRAGELVHYGPSLARELAGLKLVKKFPDLHEGIPCTRWQLRSEEKQSMFGMNASLRQDVELWIDEQEYPVAASFKKQVESKVLLFRQSYDSIREQRYERFGGRLILAFDKQDDVVRQSNSKGGKRIITTIVEVNKSIVD